MGPLKGVTIIELAGIGPGPFGCMMLADMGADIIRVDRPPASATGELARAFQNDGMVDRGRRSISVNLKDPRGVDLVLKLVKHADALIEGYRPGVAETIGLGPDVCRERNPRLVYGRMTGWGQSGPLARTAGHDLNYIALTGALHVMGSKDRPPAPPLNLVGDYGGGGMLLALGVVAALFEASRSGCGQVVDVAMVDGAAQLMAPIFDMMAKGIWRDQRESNMLDGGAHFYACYECADGRFVSIGSIEPQFYKLLLERCNIRDAQFFLQWDRMQWPELKEKLRKIFLTRTRDAWCALLEGSDVCFAPVLSMDEAPEHPHCQARGVFVEANGAAHPAPAPRFQRTPSEFASPPPQTGGDTIDLLKKIGYSDQEIKALHESGVAYSPLETNACL